MSAVQQIDTPKAKASGGNLQGRASHLGSTGLGLSQRQMPTTDTPAIKKEGIAATRAMLSSLAFRIWSISSMALSVSTLSFCTWNYCSMSGSHCKLDA